MLKNDGAIAHRGFADFPSLLRTGDVLVLNETRVVRARLRGRRIPGGGAAELLLVRPAGEPRYDPAATRWLALVRPGRRLREGARIEIGDAAVATVEGMMPDGARIVRFESALTVGELLERHGEVPLPPYIGEAGRRYADRYQTIFARTPGSVAAPTASLHFTAETFDALREREVEVVRLSLDVGPGTFRPIAGATIDEHPMHPEHYDIPPESAAAVELALAQGRRVVAAGTTVLRALEAAAQADGHVRPGSAATALYITPGFRFRAVSALLTNFHLPRSTLLVLVSAFAGHEAVRTSYREAIRLGYRFFSFGDAMFVEQGGLART